jgi:protein-disulfide isomerase
MRAWIIAVLAAVLVPAAGMAETLATVGGHAISRAQVEEQVKPQLAKVENERYEALRKGLDELIAEQLITMEAKARGVSTDELVKTEVLDKVTPPSEDAVKELYDKYKDKLGGTAFDTVKPRLMAYLGQQAAAQRREAYLKELRAKYKVTIDLRPPVVEVSEGGRESRGGGKDAPVTIIEFSDYQCPFCKRAEPTVQQVLSTYGDKVRFVYRDYPLPFHKDALPASEAAHCAAAQGKFWPYHDKLMASKDVGQDKLDQFAGEVGLDKAKFDKCVKDKKYAADIERDVKDGGEVGVNGTPTFFINGRMLDGAQTFDKFQEVIDEEIAFANQKKG